MRISDWSSDVCSSDLHQRPQAQRLHQALHRLVIDHITSLAQRHRNTSIAVAALVLRIDGQDLGLYGRVLIRHALSLQVIVERAARQLCRFEQGLKRILLPQSSHEPRFLDRKSVVSGKSVSVRVDFGGRQIINKKKKKKKK